MPDISQDDLTEIYAFAVQLGKDAGRMLLDAAKLRYEGKSAQQLHVEKENAVDLVTQTDEGKLVAHSCREVLFYTFLSCLSPYGFAENK